MAARAGVGVPLLLDGAMGTSLLDLGLPPGEPPERWLLERPEAIAAVHAAQVAAGAQVVLSCTFGLASPRLAGADLPELARRAVALARGALGARGLVAGALGPAGLARDGAAREARYRVATGALSAAGADLLWLETHWDLDEVLGALCEARATGRPVAVTFALPLRGGRFVAPGGAPAEELLDAVASSGAVAAGLNCVEAGEPLAQLAGWASGHLRIPFIAKPSPGLPGCLQAPDRFAALVAPAVRAGAALVGGCCGAGAGHVGALAAMIAEEGAGAGR